MTANSNIARTGEPSDEDAALRGDPRGGGDTQRDASTAARSPLTDRMRSFLRSRRLGVVGTFDGGRPVVEPCLAEAGFVRVLADDEIAWPATALLDERRTLVGTDERRHLSLVTVDWWDGSAELRVSGPATRRRYPPVGLDYDGPSTDWYVMTVTDAELDRTARIPRLTVAEAAPDDDPSPGSRTTYDRLVPDLKEFVDSRMAGVLATADGDGRPHLSTRFGPAGFVQVLDAHTLAWPEYQPSSPGLDNIESRGTAGLYFADWWTSAATVQVSGSVMTLEEVAGATDLTDADRATEWVLMDVERATIARDPPLPTLSVEAFDPPWDVDVPHFATDG